MTSDASVAEPLSLSSRFVPTRAAGLARLAAFLPRAGVDYAMTRNAVSPGHANVSGLSPWLRRRLLTEEEVVRAAEEPHGAANAEKFVQEVCWRTYWKGWLELRPVVWTRYLAAVARQRDELRGDRRSVYEAALAGRTDLVCFNAWRDELVATGWLHNHARMWFASIWVFTLKLPWELGAAFFLEHLSDGDPASNTLSWRWVAGQHTAGKIYLARADNIARYAGPERAPPPGALAEAATAPEFERVAPVMLRERAHEWTQVAACAGPRPGLWLHGDDLRVEDGGLATAPVVAIHAGAPAGAAAGVGVGPGPAAWERAARADGLARAAAQFGAEAEGGEHADLAATLTEWIRAKRLGAVLAYEPPVGPGRAGAAALDEAGTATGVPVIWIRRRWDARAWPQARAGFFSFWEAVRRGLAQGEGDGA